MHVALANFIDTIIDYPRSKEYAYELFDKLGVLGILAEAQIAKYKQHVVNLETYDEAQLYPQEEKGVSEV